MLLLLLLKLLLLRQHDGSLPCCQASNCWLVRHCCWSRLSNIAAAAAVFLAWILLVSVAQQLRINRILAYMSARLLVRNIPRIFPAAVAALHVIQDRLN